MIISKVKQKFAFTLAMAMVLFLMPCETVFASNMTISGGVFGGREGGLLVVIS